MPIVNPAPGAVPVGGIILWSGAIANIPSPWALCDGTLNAPGPDLRDTFVVGAKQDSGGVAKTNIEGSLKVTGGVTGHSHSAHANLSHAGLTIGDHIGLTHSLAIANHPDLTHAALSHAASTFSHADHSVASVSHTHAAITLTHADHSIASHANITVPSHSHPTLTVAASHATQAYSKGATNSAVLPATNGVVTLSGISMTSVAGASIAAATYTHADHSVPTFSGTDAAFTLTHADHSFPSLSHQAIGTHVGTDYGVHTITQPGDHGTAGTLTHAFSQPDAHTISAHDTVLSLPTYYALAYIQRMA